MICLNKHEKMKVFPTKMELKTHDLLNLKRDVVKFSKPKEKSKNNNLWKDYLFLKEDV